MSNFSFSIGRSIETVPVLVEEPVCGGFVRVVDVFDGLDGVEGFMDFLVGDIANAVGSESGGNGGSGKRHCWVSEESRLGG